MKRTPLKRKTPLRAKGRSRFPKRRDPDYASFIRAQPCIVRGCREPSEAAHVRSRGAGGDDVANLVPLCRAHHGEQHRLGRRSFERRYDLDLESSARNWGLVYGLA